MLKNTYTGFIYFLFFAGVISVEINNCYFYTDLEFIEYESKATSTSSNHRINNFKKRIQSDLYSLDLQLNSVKPKLANAKIESNHNTPFKKRNHGPKKPPKKRKTGSSKDLKKRFKKIKNINNFDCQKYSSTDLKLIGKRYIFTVSENHSQIHIPPPKFC